MRTPLLTIASLVFAVSTAFAQGGAPGAAPGATPGSGSATPAASHGTASPAATPGAPGGQPQTDRGMPPGARFDPTNTPGWAAMSAEERSEHMTRMQTFRNYGDCQAYMSQHGERMRSRAGASATTGMAAPSAGAATSRSPGGSGETAASALGGDPCGHLPRG